MATTTTNFGWDIPQSVDLVKDGATAIAALGQDIDTALVDLKGGTTGQVLAKASGTDLDFSWVAQDDSNAIQNAIVDAKGDLIAATAADTPARLAVGTNGQVLTADSTASTGIKWATPSAGKILQVVSTTKADTFSTSSTSYVDVTSLSVSITPSSSSSTILVFADVTGNGSAGLNIGAYQLVRGSTVIATPTSPSNRTPGFGAIYINDGATVSVASVNIIDSPATTSSTTYKIQARSATTGTTYVNRSQTDTDNASYIRSISSITVMEISA
jgi:hypothetical protein